MDKMPSLPASSSSPSAPWASGNAVRLGILPRRRNLLPAPGVDLQPYVYKEVGVSGQRGYMPELKKPHVTAQRVNFVDGPALR